MRLRAGDELEDLRLLQCATCGCRVPEFERGWRAYLADEECETNVIVLCPECSERDFGEDSR